MQVVWENYFSIQQTSFFPFGSFLYLSNSSYFQKVWGYSFETKCNYWRKETLQSNLHVRKWHVHINLLVIEGQVWAKRCSYRDPFPRPEVESKTFPFI